MANFSNFSEDTIINVWLRVQAAYKPPAIYIGLWTTTLTDASTGSSGTEVTGGAYARQQVAQADNEWDASSGGDGHTQNSMEIAFPTATASWGTVTDVMVVDASSAGNSIFFGALTSSKTVDTDDTFKFAIGDLDITIA